MSSSRVPHDVSTHPHQPEVSGPAPVRQWLGLLLPAAAFVVHFQLNYLLVLWVCGNDVSTLPIHLTSIVALFVCLFGVRLAFSTRRSAGPGTPSDGDGALPRTRLLGTLGIGLGAALSLILLVQLISGFVPPICE